MSATELGHFDEVRVLDTDVTRALEINGAVGVIVGDSRDASADRIAYAVYFEKLAHVVMLERDDVEPTGRSVAADEIYDGSTLHVTPDGAFAVPSYAIDDLSPDLQKIHESDEGPDRGGTSPQGL